MYGLLTETSKTGGWMQNPYLLIANKQYANDVIKGKIPACKWAKAAQRQLDKLKRWAEVSPYLDSTPSAPIAKMAGQLSQRAVTGPIPLRWSCGTRGRSRTTIPVWHYQHAQCSLLFRCTLTRSATTVSISARTDCYRA